MSLLKWTDIDRWTEIDFDDLTRQAESLTTEENKEIIKDALYTIKNSFSLIEKQKSTKEKRDRMTKERINILIRMGFQIHFRPPGTPFTSEPPKPSKEAAKDKEEVSANP